MNSCFSVIFGQTKDIFGFIVMVFLAEKGGEIFNVTSSERSFQQHEGGNNEEPGEVIDQNVAANNE